jgi:hypothetical protein
LDFTEGRYEGRKGGSNGKKGKDKDKDKDKEGEKGKEEKEKEREKEGKKEGKKGDQINTLTSLSSNGDGTERDDSVDIDSSSEGDEGECDTFKYSVSACEHFRGVILKCLNQAKLLTQVSALGPGMGMGLSGVTGKVSNKVLHDALYDLFALTLFVYPILFYLVLAPVPFLFPLFLPLV